MYRDQGDLCPRCGIPLVQAGVARGCEQCTGIWISVEHVRDMASQMQTPPAPVEIGGTREKRQQLICPTCTELMDPLHVLGIAIDVCKKRHGIWFDANELGTLLLRSAQGAR